MTVIEELRAKSRQVRKEYKESRSGTRRVELHLKVHSALKKAAEEGATEARIEFGPETNVKDLVAYLKTLGFNLENDYWIIVTWYDHGVFEKNRIVPSRKVPRVSTFILVLKIY